MISLTTNIYKDLEQFDKIFKDLALHHYQLSKGEFKTKFSVLNLKKAILWFGCINIDTLVKGFLPKDKILFIILLDESSGRHNKLNSHNIFKDTLVCMNDSSEVSCYLTQDTSYICFSISKERLTELGFDCNRFTNTYKHKANKTTQEIKKLLFELNSFDEKQRSELDNDKIYEKFLYNYVHAFEKIKRPHKLRKSRTQQIASQVYEYVLAYANDAIAMDDLSRVIGKSERTLQRAFKTTYSITIQQFIKIYRLHKVRKKLLNNLNRDNITDIAYKYGFTHLGRFSNEYKSLFGELPSRTGLNTI